MKSIFTIFITCISFFSISQKFKIDTKEATINFYYQSEDTKGVFTGVTATIDLDLLNLSKSTLNGDADITTLSTGNIARDKHLKSKTYFNAKLFPTMSFKSSEIKIEQADATHPEQTVINGTLNLKGFNKQVKFIASLIEGELVLTSSVLADDFGLAIKAGKETSLVTIEMRFKAEK